VGDVPNGVVVHSGGDGNRTRVRKAPMYGFSLRLNQFTPQLSSVPRGLCAGGRPVPPAPAIGWGRSGTGDGLPGVWPEVVGVPFEVALGAYRTKRLVWALRPKWELVAPTGPAANGARWDHGFRHNPSLQPIAPNET